MIFQFPFTLLAWLFFLSDVGSCEGCSGHRYFRFKGSHRLVAVILRREIVGSFAKCLYVCNRLAECTGIAVFKDNGTVDCTFLNTNAETIGATGTYLPTPLEDKPDFTFYLNTARQGKVGHVQRSPGYPYWLGNPWSTMDGYLAQGRLTAIRVWYGAVSPARFIHGIQIQYNGIWTLVHGESIGTRGEVLLADGETIVTVRYFVDYKQTSGMEFTTSSGTTFGPFGFENGYEIMVQTRELLWLSGAVADLWTEAGTFKVIRPIFFYFK